MAFPSQILHHKRVAWQLNIPNFQHLCVFSFGKVKKQQPAQELSLQTPDYGTLNAGWHPSKIQHRELLHPLQPEPWGVDVPQRNFKTTPKNPLHQVRSHHHQGAPGAIRLHQRVHKIPLGVSLLQKGLHQSDLYPPKRKLNCQGTGALWEFFDHFQWIWFGRENKFHVLRQDLRHGGPCPDYCF